MKKLLIFSLLVSLSLAVSAQTQFPRPPVGAAPLRSEFTPYDIRENAESRTPTRASFIPLTDSLREERLSDKVAIYSTVQTLPLVWIEREVYLHIEGAWSSCIVRINGRAIGYAEDSKTPTEFLITSHLTEGENTIMLEVDAESPGTKLEGTVSVDTPATLREAWLYSQPKLRIHDFRVTADLEDKTGKLSLEIITANSFNYSENISIGYDIYDPDGKLIYYDKRERTLPGRGTDTIRFNESVYNAQAWSPATPKLYRVMLLIWRDGRIVEYIPLKTGFRKADLETNLATLQNAKPAVYNMGDPAKAKAEMTALKKRGINLLRPEYPQPIGFYELCDELGFWVVDQANIHVETGRENRRVGGTPSNDPAWLSAYLYRTEAMFARTKNHTCILGRSLGGQSGNGYNMYRTYLLLKGLDADKPVIYDDAAGEWNSDL